MGDTQSSPQITDTSHLTEEFSPLNSSTKIHALLEMVKICSYQEQLEFHEKLNAFLHKDFITHLSSDLSTEIISYLPMEDVITCLYVSKSWYKIVSGCTLYWAQKSQALGMTDTFVSSRLSDPSCKLHALCIASQNHQRYMKHLVPRCYSISVNPTEIGYSFRYAGNGVSLIYEETASHAQVIIESMNSSQSAMQIASFDVPPFQGRIMWASASSDYLLWKQVNGTWCGCLTKGLLPELDVWEDEPMSQGSHNISFCSKCHAVAVMSQAEDDCEVWDLQVIKLYNETRGANALRKMVYPIPLEGLKQLSQNKRYFLGGEVTLLPASLEVDSSGFCQTHSVLLQIDSSLAIHKLKMIDEMDNSLVLSQLLPNSLLSKPLKVFSPKQSDQLLSLMDFSASKSQSCFCLSADLQRVAMIHEGYLNVWNLASFEMENFVDLSPLDLPTDSKVMAVGSVYTVIASNSKGQCIVVLTTTGEIILQNFMSAESSWKHAFEYYAPLNQDWLDSFVYFDFLPLGLVMESKCVKDKEETELTAMVGVRRRETTAIDSIV